MLKNKLKLLLGLLTVVAVVAVPFSAFCADGQIKIGQTSSTTFPITITSSGSYVLTSDINNTFNANAITINVDNVTIDLNGHAIIGPGSGIGHGIYASSSRYNITIVNGTVRDCGQDGLDIRGYNNIIKDVRSYNNGGVGIVIYRGTVTNCTADNNGNHGILAYHSTVTNCTAYSNGGDGIEGYQRNRIEGNNLRTNGAYGLNLSSNYNYAVRNSASGNTSGNFYEYGDNHMPITGDNANYGF